MDEGYIKYICNWVNTPISMHEEAFKNLNNWRNKFHKLSLIGVYDNGIGFGNISYKVDDSKAFYISGSATGDKAKLASSDYSMVTSWNYNKNSVDCRGELRASSESLSHAAIYDTNSNIKAVVHVHSMPLWEKYLNVLPTTPKSVPYGTPEMATAITKLLSNEKFPDAGILVMAGHEEGVISYGKDLDEAGKILVNYFSSL